MMEMISLESPAMQVCVDPTSVKGHRAIISHHVLTVRVGLLAPPPPQLWHVALPMCHAFFEQPAAHGKPLLIPIMPSLIFMSMSGHLRHHPLVSSQVCGADGSQHGGRDQHMAAHRQEARQVPHPRGALLRHMGRAEVDPLPIPRTHIYQVVWGEWRKGAAGGRYL